MFPRRRIQSDVPETEDPDGCPRDGGSRRMFPRRTTRVDWHRRMSLRRKVKTDGLAVMAFLLRDIHVCHLLWPYVSETDVTDSDVRGMLVPSKLCQPVTRTPGTTPCNQAKYGTYPFFCTKTNVTGPKSRMNITKQFKCLTYNTVYVIHCTK